MKKTDKKKYNCKDIEKNVQAYLDNRLSEKEVLMLEDHLSYCLPCDKKIEFEKRLKEIIKLKAAEKDYPEKLELDLKRIIQDSKN